MTSNTNSSLQNLGAELVYTQDATGRYLSFYWQQDNVPKHEEVSSPIQVLNLQQVVNGDLEPVIEALQIVENAEKMKAGEMEN